MSIFVVLNYRVGGRPVVDKIQTLFPGRHYRLAEDHKEALLRPDE